MGEDNVKICPFRGEDCLQDKCALWTQIQVGVIGPLGVASGQPMSMCVFQATLMVAGSPKPQMQMDALKGITPGLHKR